MRFSRPSYLHFTNIYEVNIRQYTPEGTFSAFCRHLPRLKEMGVSILWLMPVHPIGKINRKGSLGSYYSISDYCDVNPEFGTKDDLKALITVAHDLGMRVIIDWVANHAAWDNKWTVSNPEYFVRNEEGNFISPNDWDDVIQIDHNSTSQQNAMRGAMEYWVRNFNIDGFRADLAHLTPLEFWRNTREHLEQIRPAMIWLAETEEPDYYSVFDLCYTWRWMHLTEKNISANNALALKEYLVNELHGQDKHLHKMYFTSNHDENSWNGTEYERYKMFAHPLAVFSCTWHNAVPLIYSGQELPELKRLAFFDKDEIAWSDNRLLHQFYKSLLSLRNGNPAFVNESNVELIETDNRLLIYYRHLDNYKIITVLNFSNEEVSVALPEWLQGNYYDIFSGMQFDGTNLTLIPAGYMVLK